MIKHFNTIIRVLTIILLVIAQIVFIMMLPKWLKMNAVVVYVLIEVVSIFLLCHLMAEETNASYKILWLVTILLLPVSGHVMYEFWGKEGSHEKHHREIHETVEYYKKKKRPDPQLQEHIKNSGMPNYKISNYLYNNGYPAYQNTQVEYYELVGETFEQLLKDLRNAKKFIFISCFTIADGHLLNKICEILEFKALEGVEIKLMYDDAGSIFQLSDDSIKLMKKHKIQIKKFNSIETHFHRQYFHYRNHQNIVIVDGDIAYTGGVNITDQHVNMVPGMKNIKDVALRMYGEASWGLTLTFLGMWDKERRMTDVEKYKPTVEVASSEIYQPYADGPTNNPDNPARDMFHLMANMADKELLIMTPYLVLDDETKECLCLAAKSGVDIKIITPGVAGKKMAKWFTEWTYGSLLKEGIHIYEYMPGFVHAKMCVNDTSGFLGTVNMDFRSFYMHYECGVWFCESMIREQIYNDFYKTLQDCREITLADWKKRPLYRKTIQLLLQPFKCQF